MAASPAVSVLWQDPPRKHRINADSYQQHALTTFNGYQYAAFYISSTQPSGEESCYACLARRTVGDDSFGPWQNIVFDDYEQTMDDGHNTISIGICKGDGTIHMSYDHHCDHLRYRVSIRGLAKDPEQHAWTMTSFGKTADTLPGLQHTDLMDEITYPRFVNVEDDLLLSYRIGQAGSGSDLLYHYDSSTGSYEYIGMPLKGVGNSPYINGMDYRNGRVQISWCYRGFVEYEGVHDANNTSHKAQAGPNGPENNYGLFYAFSEDRGRTWCGSSGSVVARLRASESSQENQHDSIKPDTKDILVFDIPKYSGILNQEGQGTDCEGQFHVLNREKVDGVERWMVYSRNAEGSWRRLQIPGLEPTEIGSRGSICADQESNIYCVLPGNTDSSLTVMRALRSQNYGSFAVFWQGDGYDGEPLVDILMLDEKNILSVFTRTAEDASQKRNVVVLDFALR